MAYTPQVAVDAFEAAPNTAEGHRDAWYEILRSLSIVSDDLARQASNPLISVSITGGTEEIPILNTAYAGMASIVGVGTITAPPSSLLIQVPPATALDFGVRIGAWFAEAGWA